MVTDRDLNDGDSIAITITSIRERCIHCKAKVSGDDCTCKDSIPNSNTNEIELQLEVFINKFKKTAFRLKANYDEDITNSIWIDFNHDTTISFNDREDMTIMVRSYDEEKDGTELSEFVVSDTKSNL